MPIGEELALADYGEYVTPRMASRKGEAIRHGSPRGCGLHALAIMLIGLTLTGCTMLPTTNGIPWARFFTKCLTSPFNTLYSCTTLDNSVRSADEFT